MHSIDFEEYLWTKGYSEDFTEEISFSTCSLSDGDSSLSFEKLAVKDFSLTQSSGTYQVTSATLGQEYSQSQIDEAKQDALAKNPVFTATKTFTTSSSSDTVPLSVD